MTAYISTAALIRTCTGFQFSSTAGQMVAVAATYCFVARARNCTSALRSASELMICSGILVPGV